MIFMIINYLTVFVTFFFILSLFNLVINFMRALLSNPPKKFTLDGRALIYYGLCVSYLLTLLYFNLK